MRTLLIVAAIVLGMSGSARADGAVFKSGNHLHGHCSSEDTFDVTYCLAYIAGVSDAMANDSILGFRSCRPTSVSQAQVRDVVKAYLENNPQKRHFDARSLIATAVAEAFPCK